MHDWFYSGGRSNQNPCHNSQTLYVVFDVAIRQFDFALYKIELL